MNYRNRPLYAAVAACFGVVAGNAVAVDLTSASSSAKFAKELPITSTSTLTLINSGGNLDMRMPTVSGFSPTTSNPLFIKIALTQNAKFSSTPSITCSGITGGSALGEATSYTGSVTFGGAGSTQVTFQITATNNAVGGSKLTGASGCVVTMSGITITAAIVDVAASAQYEYVNGISPTVSAIAAAPYISFVRSVTAVAAEAAGGVTVNAIGGSTRFTSTSNGGSALAIFGSVRVFGNGTGASATTALTLSAGDAIQSATITISGPAIAAGLALGNSGVFLSNTSDCGTKDILVSSSAASSVTFTANGASLTQLSAASGLTVCMNVSGNASQIMTGQITASLSPTPVTNVTADLSLASPNLENVVQNGTTKNAYFLHASGSVSKTSILRVVNTGGATGDLRATAYDEAGAILGVQNATIAAGVANNQMVTLTSAQLETALGFTPSGPTAKYRVLISGNLASFKILNYSRENSTGMVTLSQGQDD